MLTCVTFLKVMLSSKFQVYTLKMRQAMLLLLQTVSIPIVSKMCFMVRKVCLGNGMGMEMFHAIISLSPLGTCYQMTTVTNNANNNNNPERTTSTPTCFLVLFLVLFLWNNYFKKIYKWYLLWESFHVIAIAFDQVKVRGNVGTLLLQLLIWAMCYIAPWFWLRMSLKQLCNMLAVWVFLPEWRDVPLH